MSTHKRKGSDFGAVSVATVNTSRIHPSPGNDNSHGPSYKDATVEEEWQAIQKYFQEMNAKYEDASTLPTIDRLLQRPRIVQERIGQLSQEAEVIKHNLNQEFQKLQDEYQQQCNIDSERQRRLAELQEQQEDLCDEYQALERKKQQVQAALERQREAIRQAKQEALQSRQQAKLRQKEMNKKISKLKQQISMYNTCTGINWDHDNEEAFVGAVVRFGKLFRFWMLFHVADPVSLSLCLSCISYRVCPPNKAFTSFIFHVDKCPRKK